MKKLIIGCIIAILGPNFATAMNPNDVFKSEKDQMSITRISLTDDPESSYSYLIYKDSVEKRKIRYVWNGGCCEDGFIYEFLFQDKKLVLVRHLKLTKENYEGFIDGIETDETVLQEFYFENSKLIRWFENGEEKPFELNDSWVNQQTQIIEEVRETLKTYTDNKDFEEELSH